jgi:hypothetical protein
MQGRGHGRMCLPLRCFKLCYALAGWMLAYFCCNYCRIIGPVCCKDVLNCRCMQGISV